MSRIRDEGNAEDPITATTFSSFSLLTVVSRKIALTTTDEDVGIS
jgi:hypothetical protein